MTPTLSKPRQSRNIPQPTPCAVQPTILAAIHGILTNQTDPSWPDKLDAWMFFRDPSIKVVKKEYRAGPFPHWNCLVKDPAIAHSLANELELLLAQTPRSAGVPAGAPPLLPGWRGEGRGDGQLSTINSPTINSPALWFVAHSNGAVIALQAAAELIARGHKIAGMILTGAAVDPDILENQIFDWIADQSLRAAIAYSSPDDNVLAGPSGLPRALWSTLIRPYGRLGQTGWLCNGQPLLPTTINHQQSTLQTRWFPGGHSTYFASENIDRTFELIHQDIDRSRRRQPTTRRSIPIRFMHEN